MALQIIPSDQTMGVATPHPSDEQQDIIDSLNNHNVIGDAVAGSGKTTTALLIAQRYSSLKILLLTYNAKLKIETREKVRQYNINNLEAHSYHAFCVKYYDKKAFKDEGIIKIVDNDKKCKMAFKYDIVIIDECQDVTPLYYRLICKIFKDMNSNSKICILGDRYQSIFQFNHADERFIIYAKQVFNFNTFDWKECKLSTSYRITNQMADFVNICMLRYNRIQANKDGNKVNYVICDSFGWEPYHLVKAYLAKGYNSEDIFILAPSIKGLKSPIRKLANRLSDLDDIPIFAPVTDDEKLDKDILKGKLVVSSFHQVKGLERKIVIVFNFDDSYFKFYAKNKSPNICSNELYVATTRSIKELVVLHHKKDDYLPFINKERIKEVCNFNSMPLSLTSYSPPNLSVAVTKLIKHLPSTVCNIAMKYLHINKIQEGDEDEFIDIPIKVRQHKTIEPVSEITGTAVHLYYEYKSKGHIGITDRIYTENNRYRDVLSLVRNMSPSNILKFANYHCSIQSGYIHKLNQIKQYDWLSQVNLDKCISRLQCHLTDEGKHEVEVSYKNDSLNRAPELLNRELHGCIDCIDIDVWEFKCVKQLEPEHFLQLGVYMYLYKKIYPHDDDTIQFKLFNILSNEIYQIEASMDELIEMVKFLMINKYVYKKKIDDQKFLDETTEMRNSYTNNIDDSKFDTIYSCSDSDDDDHDLVDNCGFDHDIDSDD